MEKDLKDILLKDLCARLPYGIKVQMADGPIEELLNVNVSTFICNGLRGLPKPYLFPLSSMTKEQRYELHDLIHNLNVLAINGEIGDWIVSSSEIDWYNKNHIDYRGLISKGLAIDATGLNVY